MAGLFFGHHGPFFMGKKEAVFTAHEVAFEEGEDDAWDKGELDEYGWPTHQEVAIDEDRPGVGVAPPDIDEIVDEGPAQAPDEHGGYKAEIEVKVHPFCLHEAEEKTGHSPIKGTFDHHRRKDRVKGRHASDEAIEERGEKPDPEPEEAPADEAAVETQGNMQGAFLSREKVDIIQRVRDMKDSKIDLFLDSAVNGDIPLEVCDDIVDFLKTDISVCDAILSIDFQDHASVLEGFRRIITVLSESKDPQHQDEYVGSLTPEEAQLEYGYSQVLNSLQGMMMYLRDEL